MPHPRCLLVLLSLAAFGCRTSPTEAPPARPPLAIVEAIPVHYESTVAPWAALDSVWTQEAGAEDSDEPSASEPSEVVIHVDAEIVELEPDDAAAMLGAPAGLGGWVADRQETRDALQELIDSGRAERIHEARLGIHEDEPAWVTIGRQEAFVASYDVSRSPAALLADPSVRTLGEGFRMRTLASLDPAGAARLDLELTLVELERPIASMTVSIPGSTTPVTLQLPVAKHQVLSTDLSLTEDRCALLSGLASSGNTRGLLVFLTVGMQR